MAKIVDVRCEICGKLLFQIIDDEWIKIYCTRNKAHKLLYHLPQRPLTQYKESDKIILNR